MSCVGLSDPRLLTFSGSETKIPGAAAPGIYRSQTAELFYEFEGRRSAVQEPEHSPPLQRPSPMSPLRRPEPLALLPAALTMTMMAPVGCTLPLMSMLTLPAFCRMPLVMRIG